MIQLRCKIGALAVMAGLLAVAAEPQGAVAMPLDATVRAAARSLDYSTIQHRPGYYAGRQYRRAMRRYRGDPGSRSEIRRNRRDFCRGAPQYC